jgi:hypothetical protein
LSINGEGIDQLALGGTNLFALGKFNSLGGMPQDGLAKLSTQSDGRADAAWNPSVRFANCLALDGTNLFVGGFNVFGSATNQALLAKLTTTGAGTVDTNWNAQFRGNGSVYALLVDGPNLFVGGSFTSIGGLERHSLAKFATAGTGQVDPLWDPQVGSAVVFFEPITSLARDGGNLLAGGFFSSVGGVVRRDLARVNAAGTGAVDLSFNPGPAGNSDFDSFPSSDVRALFLSGRDLYLGGGFTTIGGADRSGFALLPVADAPVIIQDTSTDLLQRPDSNRRGPRQRLRREATSHPHRRACAL